MSSACQDVSVGEVPDQIRQVYIHLISEQSCVVTELLGGDGKSLGSGTQNSKGRGHTFGPALLDLGCFYSGQSKRCLF